jgi:hypothetical protein
LIEAEGKDTRPGRGAEKKKDGRPPCDIAVLLNIVLYGAMEHIYSSRALAACCTCGFFADPCKKFRLSGLLLQFVWYKNSLS